MLNQLKGVFSSFQKYDVRYVVIGGIAAILYGVPRATFDLDILVEATEENVGNLLSALLDAGIGTASLTSIDEVLKHEITIFPDKVRIDVQMFTPGLEFERAWTEKVAQVYDGQEFYLVSREHLIASKKAAGRPQDIQDVEMLEARDNQ